MKILRKAESFISAFLILYLRRAAFYVILDSIKEEEVICSNVHLFLLV